MYSWLKRLLALTLFATLAACGGGDDDPHPVNIVETAKADLRFGILIEAVTAAGLDNALAGPGPFTLFAPTDDAFGALLSELGLTKAGLLADKALLTTVLKYHVLSGKVVEADVPAGKAITPLEGGIFKVDAVGAELVITDGRNRTSKITTTDLAASNGVIHVIDRVLLPADKTIVATAEATSALSTLVEAVTAAGLVDTLKGAGPYTVFAPTNEAFAALLVELGLSKAALLADKALLTRVLAYHVLGSRVLKADVPVGAAVTTLQGETFTVDATLAITDQRARKSNITATDVLASNGVVHLVDKVILPAP